MIVALPGLLSYLFCDCGTPWTFLLPFFFEAIVAGPVCQTHRLSNLIDILLRPLTKRVNSYLRDTTDFLNHLTSDVSENTLYAKFDVDSLYSNIPHELGNEAINYWLRKFPNDSPARFPKNFILEGINFILKNNIFCFNGKKATVKLKELQWA